MKKVVVMITIVTLLLLTCVACQQRETGPGVSDQTVEEQTPSDSDPTAQTKPSKSSVLRVGVMPAASGAPIQYAYEKGFFADEGLSVELSVFATGVPINEAIAAGELDIAAIGSAGIFSLANELCQLIMETNTADGVAIYARPDSDILTVQGQLPDAPEVYGSTELIKGKSIIAPLATTQQLMADAYAECFNCTGELNIINMEPGPAYQAFITGQADLLATFPPYSIQAAEAGMVEVAKFERISGYSLTDLLIATNKVIEEREDDVTKFLSAVIKANDALQDDALRAEFSQRWFAENAREYSDEDMAQEIAVRRYYSAEMMDDDNYYMGKSLIELGKFYVESGSITEDDYPNIARSINTSFVEKILNITVNAAK